MCATGGELRSVIGDAEDDGGLRLRAAGVKVAVKALRRSFNSKSAGGEMALWYRLVRASYLQSVLAERQQARERAEAVEIRLEVLRGPARSGANGLRG